MKIERVWVSAGHGMNSKSVGNYDPGHVHGEWEEAELNLWLKDGLRLLRPQFYLDVPPNTIRGRIDFVNRRYEKGDLLIEIHHNSSPGASGVEVIYSWAAPQARAVEAGILSRAAADVLGIRDRGPLVDLNTPAGWRRGLPIVRESRMPAYLIEMGFMQSDKDRDASILRGVAAIDGAIQALKEKG